MDVKVLSSTNFACLDYGFYNQLDDCCRHTILFENIPKILAMLLNKEGVLSIPNPAEKTDQLTGEDRFVYTEWLHTFRHLFKRNHQTMESAEIEFLARKNAEYLLSVFTPITVVCSISTKQLGHIVGYFKSFTDEGYKGDFYAALRKHMLLFLKKIEHLDINGLICDNKIVEPLINNNEFGHNECFSEVFSTTYLGSYAQLYELQSLNSGLSYTSCSTVLPEFYTPQILFHDKELVMNWLWEMKRSSVICPQGKCIMISERGTYENFILKANRCFTQASLPEASIQTNKTLQIYLECTEGFNNLKVNKQLGGIVISPEVDEIINVNQSFVAIEN